MAQDINALIAMAQNRNAQGAFDPSASPQTQIAQVAALVQQGLLTPQQAQQFMGHIMNAAGRLGASVRDTSTLSGRELAVDPQSSSGVDIQAHPYSPRPNPQAPGSDVMNAIRQGGGPQSPDAWAAAARYLFGGPGGGQTPQSLYPQINFGNPGPQPNPNTGLPPTTNLGIRG